MLRACRMPFPTAKIIIRENDQRKKEEVGTKAIVRQHEDACAKSTMKKDTFSNFSNMKAGVTVSSASTVTDFASTLVSTVLTPNPIVQ